MNGINKIKIAWYSFKNAIGVGDEGKNNAFIAAAENDEKVREAETRAAQDRKRKADENVKNTQDAFSKLSWNNKTLKSSKDDLMNALGMGGSSGIKPPKIPGGLDNDMSMFGGDDKKGKKGHQKGLKTDKTNEAIATGGTKHNYITINLKDLVGVLNITGSDFKETTAQLQQQVEDALIRTLATAETAGI